MPRAPHKSVETTPDGFYAVCPIRRGDFTGYFWAAWWSTSLIFGDPTPNTHGIVTTPQAAHAEARKAIVEAQGPKASVLQLDAAIAIEAARIVRPEGQGYRTGEHARDTHESPGPARAPGRRQSPRDQWLKVLGLTWPCTATEVRKAYKRLARQRHPDRGGTDSAFDTLTKAYEAALTDLEMSGHH